MFSGSGRQNFPWNIINGRAPQEKKLPLIDEKTSLPAILLQDSLQ